MAGISTNEREWQGEVVKWFAAALRAPFTAVGQETGVAGQFPDLVFWEDRSSNLALVSGELKGTEISARDPAVLKNAIEKSANLKVKLLLTWNMTEAVVWSIRGGVAEPLWSYPQIDVPGTKRWREKEAELRALATDIAHDLAWYLAEGRVPSNCHVESTVFVEAIHTTASDLVPFYRGLLNADAIAALKWCVRQGIASDDGFETASRQVVYRLIGQILFYQTLARVRGDLKQISLSESKAESVQASLKSAFKAARNIDYFAVFKEDYPDTLQMTDPIARHLARFCNSFDALDLPKMGADIIGRIFESLIPADEKKKLGQYFTEPWLADLLVTGAIRSGDDLVFDPACGTGAILMRAYMFMKSLKPMTHGDLLDRLWGSDIADFPVELAMINLFRQSPGDIANFPRVIKEDLFDMKVGKEIEMPPNKQFGGIQKITLKFPQFDAIVANPPYVRYQSIGAGASDPDAYREQLFARFQMLDSTSDLFAFVYAHCGDLLKSGGRIAFVTGNSWLDADYGEKLKEFFLRNFKVLAVLESRCEPWFENAKVNTVVTALEKSASYGTTSSDFLPEDLRHHKVAFVKLKKPLQDLVSHSLSDPSRFQRYLRLWADIENGADNVENSEFRMRKRTQQHLFEGIRQEVIK